MLLSGRLSDWSVEDLLQMLHITKKTASLHVDGEERSGVVYFDEGAVVGAEVSVGSLGGTDRDGVIEALYVLQLLDDGEFEMRNEVSPNAIESLSVAEALELAAGHIDAERTLDETGLLGARGLRLAQEIDEPIILSEQVWAAISVSIPAFTFAELEQRMGRAAAVETLEQFRDLGVLEAVLDEPEQSMSDVTAAGPDHESEQAVSDATAVAPEVYEVDIDDDIDPAPLTPFHDETDDELVPDDEDESWIEPRHDVSPVWMADEDQPESSEDSPAEIDDLAPSEQPQSTGASLSDAIRAAAAAAPAAPEASPGDSDDESDLLTEAAGDEDEEQAVPGADATDVPVGSGLRRTVRALVSPPDTTLVQGVLDDLGTRFRHQSGD